MGGKGLGGIPNRDALPILEPAASPRNLQIHSRTRRLTDVPSVSPSGLFVLPLPSLVHILPAGSARPIHHWSGTNSGQCTPPPWLQGLIPLHLPITNYYRLASATALEKASTCVEDGSNCV
jgi:hypothetical protein